MEPQVNPFQLWKQVYVYAEQNYSDLIAKNMQEETFAAWIGASQQWYLFYQDMHNKMLESFFHTNKLVSQDDLARLSSLVLQIEEKVDALDEKVDDELLLELKNIRESLVQLKSAT
ncbi:hypothetical protein [Ammoniphilus sp. CFH 90114]|uniref:hypothetical protein n=1 Tax=Ammoniphilus sp. CFH 90114 TaxID=2493665 RepID=UPI00100F9E26|nr:hypothetical protein [Ammoniphilus sp. CFH 90114]RXT06251.1 hypothetical protein EIZ39_14275 [Ammoniphilus sp. CFH 90114]